MGGPRVRNPAFGRKLPALFERCGLNNIRHESSAEVTRATSPWGRWWRETLEGIRANDEAAGSLTPERKEEVRRLDGAVGRQVLLVYHRADPRMLGTAPGLATGRPRGIMLFVSSVFQRHLDNSAGSRLSIMKATIALAVGRAH